MVSICLFACLLVDSYKILKIQIEACKFNDTKSALMILYVLKEQGN